jgi:phosphoribosylanthranilate isomerase
MSPATLVPAIKFCGLRRPEDIVLVNHCRPEYAGLIFAPGKRQVGTRLAQSLINSLEAGIAPVGVFVDEPADRIATIAAVTGLRVVQLHGREGPQEWQRLRSLLPSDVEIWQKLAIPLDAGEAVRRAAAFESILDALDPVAARPRVILLDTEIGSASGGTGHVFPWQALAGFAARHRIALAGGLNPDNVRSAIASLKPAIVDCSSGIERDLNKQADLMEQFCSAVRQPERM